MSRNPKAYMKKSVDLHKVFAYKKILITGGTGSIGSEIVRQLIPFGPDQIRIYSRDETKHFFLEKELSVLKRSADIRYLIGDIRDKERLNKAFFDVDIVFHAAALKHVPYCEYNPFEAIKTNVHGTQNIVDLALEHDVEKVIAISTDKAVYPNTIMGVTKLLMERIVVSSQNYLGNATTKFSVVRFGNVLNSRGSVIPTWIEQIKEGGPVTVTDKHMRRYFMSIPDAVRLVFLASAKMMGQEIMVLKMEEKSVYEMAQQTIKKYAQGKDIGIKIIGVREREKMTEKLFTKEESELLIDNGSFYIILPDKKTLQQRKLLYLKE